MSGLSFFSGFFSGKWRKRLFGLSDRETTYIRKGEILIVFLIGYLIALSLWLMVNLGREYHITLNVPLKITGYSDEMAFARQPPGHARVGVSGEGWSLLNLYRNPPEITIDYGEGTVPVAEIIQDHLANFADLTVQKVQPPVLQIVMEPRITRKVPVEPILDVRFKSQYELKRPVMVRPDSVTVTGAMSLVDTLTRWPTDILMLRNVQDRVERSIRLADINPLLERDFREVNLSFDVTEYTEGEIRIYVRARNVPAGTELRFNPSVITVRYDVPIEYYSEAQDIVPYEAYVYYEEVARDTVGFVVPVVRSTAEDLDLRLRSFQPRRVSWFRVIEP